MGGVGKGGGKVTFSLPSLVIMALGETLLACSEGKD